MMGTETSRHGRALSSPPPCEATEGAMGTRPAEHGTGGADFVHESE